MSLMLLQNCCISVRHICAGVGGRFGLFFIGWWGKDYWLLLKMIPSKLLQGLLWLIKPESLKMYYNSSCCLEIILFDPDASIWSAVQRKQKGRRKSDGKSLKAEGEEICSFSHFNISHAELGHWGSPLARVLICAEICEEDSPVLPAWGTDTLESLLEGHTRHGEVILLLV